MEKLRELPESETRRIYWENAYIILSVMCSLSDSLNLSENSKKLCRNILEGLSEEIGEEDILIHME